MFAPRYTKIKLLALVVLPLACHGWGMQKYGNPLGAMIEVGYVSKNMKTLIEEHPTPSWAPPIDHGLKYNLLDKVKDIVDEDQAQGQPNIIECVFEDEMLEKLMSWAQTQFDSCDEVYTTVVQEDCDCASYFEPTEAL